MITHDMVSEQWELDYPKPKDVARNLENLPEITLTLENKYNKYWDFYYKVQYQLNQLNTKLTSLENILKLYYTKKPISERLKEKYNLEPLQIAYTKQEIDSVIKADERYCELIGEIKVTESLLKRIEGCIKFITSWGFNQKEFAQMHRINSGYLKE